MWCEHMTHLFVAGLVCEVAHCEAPRHADHLTHGVFSGGWSGRLADTETSTAAQHRQTATRATLPCATLRAVWCM